MDKNGKRKLRSGIMAALLLMLILLTGTYAWTQFNNVGFNAVDVVTNFGGRLHNSMEVRENSGVGRYNQNVFAENFGENRIFVRVRLREFMSTTVQGIPLIEGTSINHPNGLGLENGTPGNYRPWPAYQARVDDVHERRAGSDSAMIGRNVEWTLGHTGGPMYFMPTFNRTNIQANNMGTVPAPFNNLNAFQMIETSGDAVDAIAGGFAIGEVDGAREIRETGMQTSPQRADEEYSDGSREFWEGATSIPTPVVYVNDVGELVQSAPVVSAAEQTNMPATIPGITNGVMTFAQWHEIGMEIGNFWVMDAESGWFYYAMPLVGGEATSLLLSEIYIEDRNDEGIEYVIQVDAEFAIRSRVATDMFEDEPLPEDVAMLWGEFGYEATFNQDIPLEIERETPTLAGEVSMSRVSLMSGLNVPVQNPTVTWTVEGVTAGSATPPGVSVDSVTGMVTVDNIAPGGEEVAYVVATAEAPSGETAEARRRIDVLQFLPTLPMVEHTQENIESGASLWTDPETGVVWRVLLPDDGDGNALIITEHVHGWTHNELTFEADDRRFNTVNEFRAFEGSNLQTTMNRWFDHTDSVGVQIRNAALSYEFQDNDGNVVARTEIGAGIEFDWTPTNNERPEGTPAAVAWTGSDFRRAMTRPEGNPGSGQVFALSRTEANTLFPDGDSRNATRVDNGNLTSWWVRSPSGNLEDSSVPPSQNPGMTASSVGVFHVQNMTNTSNGFRPALWVRR